MIRMKRSLVLLAFAALLSCSDDKKTPAENTQTTEPVANNFKDEYPEVPDGNQLFTGDANDSLYTELKQRYVNDLNGLKTAVEANGAKLIVVLITPEVGAAATRVNKALTPFIQQTASEKGIEFFDLTKTLETYKPEEITQIPKDGHWSVKGAAVIADALVPVLSKYDAHRSTAKFDTRPETFGDQEPNTDQVLDGGKDLPYHVVTNKQGLRMQGDVQFPKTKQRILFLGDSQLFSPFLDNEQTTIGVLQQKMPNKELLNAAFIGYTLEDYLSLYNQKGKFTEADIVVVGTNPNDLADYFFSQRNKMSRSQKPYAPSAIESATYKKLFSK
jgi:hypothetical protein